MSHDHTRVFRSGGWRRFLTSAALLPACCSMVLLQVACEKKGGPAEHEGKDDSERGGATGEPAQPFQIYQPFVLPAGHPPERSLDWKPKEIDPQKLARDRSLHPGRKLAEIHCIRCHLLPAPEQLPRRSWPFVMTAMANYLGYRNTFGFFEGIVEQAEIPETVVVSEAELQSIAEYYQSFAPTEDAIRRAWKTQKPVTTRFEVRKPVTTIPPGGLISLVHFDDEKDHYYVGWANQLQLHRYDTAGNRLMAIPLSSEPVHMELTERGFRLAVMGHFLRDSDQGAVLEMTTDSDGKLQQTNLVTDYHRLTESHLEDLNADGLDDLLLVGFGQGTKGEVAIRWGAPAAAGGRFQGETVLIDYSGADNAVLHDFNNDQRLDIMVLTSQRQQELLLFLNQGDQQFEKRVLHKEFAGFGYNNFSLCDFNGDGRQDVLVANGNNMELEYPPIKPYHGVRIFENQGDLTFTEKYFYPMFGALKAIAEDFDHDGDPDIAAIAYYPDWAAETPETFAYLENLGGYRFRPAILEDKDWGRWISMTTGDVDNDGFRDLILGGAYHPIGVDMNYYDRYLQRIRGRASLVVLRNSGAGPGNSSR